MPYRQPVTMTNCSVASCISVANAEYYHIIYDHSLYFKGKDLVS